MALGERPGTLRWWIRQGCPVASPGRRGRGGRTLIDPDAVREWRSAGDRERFALELAAALPNLLAKAAIESHRLAQGIDKRAVAGLLAASWYVGASAVLDHLRAQGFAVPDLVECPPEIDALRKIAVK